MPVSSGKCAQQLREGLEPASRGADADDREPVDTARLVVTGSRDLADGRRRRRGRGARCFHGASPRSIGPIRPGAARFDRARRGATRGQRPPLNGHRRAAGGSASRRPQPPRAMPCNGTQRAQPIVRWPNLPHRTRPSDNRRPLATAGPPSAGRLARRGSGGDRSAAKAAGTEELGVAFPFNANKPLEYDPEAALAPPRRASAKPDDPIVGASTVTEVNGVGEGRQRRSADRARTRRSASLDRVRVDSTDQALTTNQGVPVADNQNSLKAGLRGPTLLEDFILREKITHFDHERIPERIVHARGSAAHGYFECYEAARAISRARRCSPRPASGRRCSCASRPCSASAARPTRRATCAASR